MATTDTVGSTFVDRQAELGVLLSKLNEARAGEPRVVLVEGPAGIGKTALIRRFVASTDHARVLRAGGVEEENLLPFGVAEQLARSARVPLSKALATLGRRSERSPEPVAIGGAFIDLLGILQRDGPVVLVVDDVQWADRPTLLALLFALRRLEADRVLALLAGREEARTNLPEGLVRLFADEHGATMQLEGLEVTDLQALGAALTGTRLPAQLAQHLRQHTGGSPLHARALLEEVPLEKLGQGADAPLPSPQSFSAQVLRRLAGCPPDAQQLVLAASVLGEQCPLGLARRLAGIEDPLMALEGAMSARLLEAHDDESERGIGFPHALVRAAVYHDLGPARRAALHRRAAELVEDEAASLRHRVAAAPEEDEVLASDLADYAWREGRRGAWTRAAAAMLRASRFTATRTEREVRLLEGVDCLLVGGDVPTALTFSDQVDAVGDGPCRRYVQGRLAFHSGRPSEGEELLLGAWDGCDPATERELAARIATEISYVLIRRARGDQLVTWSRHALAAAEGTQLALTPMGLLAAGLAHAGRAQEGLAEVAFLPDQHRITSMSDVGAVCARGFLRMVIGDLVRARRDLTAMHLGAARFGPFNLRLAGLALLSTVEYRLGAWDDAIVHGELAASLGEDSGQIWLLTLVHLAAATPLAGRGLWEAAESHEQAVLRHAQHVNDDTGRADAAMVQAQLAAARGDHEAVVRSLQGILKMPEREGIDEPGTRWHWHELYADAQVSLGHLSEADAVLVPFEQRARLRERHSALTNAARVRGNLEAARGETAAAEAAFLAGLDHAERITIPFDRARLEAAYGGFLRRLGKRTEAVAHLRAAQESFTQLGARPYLERCDRELAGCGLVRARRRDPDRTRLTPHELSVAKLVASGMNNRRVAVELIVSINTVEYHLKNIYIKLGIRSREQLAEELARI
jgi:ATP/maltotriose-dependent transcriptional regulator MalT